MRYFVKAKVHEFQGNHLGAIVALRSAADLDPTSPTICAQLSLMYERIQDWSMAASFARRSLELDPGQTGLRHRLVRWLDATGQEARAAKELESLLEREPGDWPLYSHLAQLYLASNQPHRIGEMFDRVLERPDVPFEVRVNIAHILARSGERVRAATVYEDIVAAEPEAVDAWIGLAEVRSALKDREGAVSALRQAGRILPESRQVMDELAGLMATPADLQAILIEEDVRFLYRLGLALSERDQHSLAALPFERIVGLKPRSVDGWLNPARHYLRRDDIDGLNRTLQQATAAMPDSVELYLFWGAALEHEGHEAEAEAVYAKAIERLPREVELYLHWGFGLEQQERWRDAIEVYRRGLAIAAPSAQLYVRWGVALGSEGRWEEAAGKFRRATEADSLHAEAFVHWGMALQRSEQWDAAIARLSRAVEIDPRETFSLFYLGGCLEQAARARGDTTLFNRAVKAFRQILEINPQDAYSLNYLGYMYAERGVHLDEAAELLQRAIALDPDNGAFLDSLGWTYFQLGDLERAEDFLSRALEQLAGYEGEEQAVIFEHAGDVAHARGKLHEATGFWRQALDLSPDSDEIRRKLGGDAETTPRAPDTAP